MSNTVNTYNNQNILDIAIQETGGIESIFELAMDNGVSITEEITPGMKLLSKQSSVNNVVLAYYKKYKLLPATGKLVAEAKGIGTMKIGSTFKIK